MERTIEKAYINSEDEFILVDVEGLSLEDEFMRFKPYKKDIRINELRGLIAEAIKANVKNFYRPKNDPSFIDSSEKISFAPGKKPAVRKTYDYWECAAKDYAPERGSRLGTKLEYAAFMGVLIKKLIDDGMSIDDAWDKVCWDSRKLGHFLDSENAKERLELTGSREVYGFCDLGNTLKLLASDEFYDIYWYAGGDYTDSGKDSPLANLFEYEQDYYDDDYTGYFEEEDNKRTVGWVVLEK